MPKFQIGYTRTVAFRVYEEFEAESFEAAGVFADTRRRDIPFDSAVKHNAGSKCTYVTDDTVKMEAVSAVDEGDISR